MKQRDTISSIVAVVTVLVSSFILHQMFPAANEWLITGVAILIGVAVSAIVVFGIMGYSLTEDTKRR